MKPPEPGRPLRFVSAASLFDGHDAAINMIRRLLQSGGAEVVHLGHNRSVADIVRAAIAEDADAIAVSSYQGGHNEYFRYMIDMLRELGADAHPRGGGRRRHDLARRNRRARGVRRRQDLHARGRAQPRPQRHDRRRVRARRAGAERTRCRRHVPRCDDHGAIARAITLLEGGGSIDGGDADDLRRQLSTRVAGPAAARRSSVSPAPAAPARARSPTNCCSDSCAQFPERNVAVVAIDPTRRRSGGALLGDRIRMNSLARAAMCSCVRWRRAASTSPPAPCWRT